MSHLGERVWTWVCKRTGLVNNTAWNRYHWKKYLAGERSLKQGVVGFDWGHPEASDDYYGNYRQILDWLKNSISKDSHVVEIGSYGGKWTQYMAGARQITCVDLFEESFDFLKERLAGLPLNFYRTRGDELDGIATESADLVFSMDSFVRIPKKSIRKYFGEIHRILKKGGKVLIHLPCSDIPFCRRKAFTSISKGWIGARLEEAGFAQYRFHFNLLKHGVFLHASK